MAEDGPARSPEDSEESKEATPGEGALPKPQGAGLAPPEAPYEAYLQRIRLAQDQTSEVLTAYRELQIESETHREQVTEAIERRYFQRRDRLLLASIGVLEKLDHAIDAAQRTGAADALIQGLILVRSLLLRTVQDEGLERVPVLGRPYEPGICRAVATRVVDDPGQHAIVLEELQGGVRIGGRLARSAAVVVGVYPGMTAPPVEAPAAEEVAAPEPAVAEEVVAPEVAAAPASAPEPVAAAPAAAPEPVSAQEPAAPAPTPPEAPIPPPLPAGEPTPVEAAPVAPSAPVVVPVPEAPAATAAPPAAPEAAPVPATEAAPLPAPEAVPAPASEPVVPPEPPPPPPAVEAPVMAAPAAPPAPEPVPTPVPEPALPAPVPAPEPMTVVAPAPPPGVAPAPPPEPVPVGALEPVVARTPPVGIRVPALPPQRPSPLARYLPLALGALLIYGGTVWVALELIPARPTASSAPAAVPSAPATIPGRSAGPSLASAAPSSTLLQPTPAPSPNVVEAPSPLATAATLPPLTTPPRPSAAPSPEPPPKTAKAAPLTPQPAVPATLPRPTAEAPRIPPAAAQVPGLLEQAGAALAAERYDDAVGLYDQALKSDPQSEGASAGKRRAVAARELARRTFVTGRTVVQTRGSGRRLDGFDTEEVELAKAPKDTGRMSFEARPARPKPGEMHTVLVYLTNEGKKAFKVSGMSVTTTVDGSRKSGPVTPLATEVSPGKKVLLVETAQVWDEGTTSWSLEAVVTTPRGETFRAQLTWR